MKTDISLKSLLVAAAIAAGAVLASADDAAQTDMRVNPVLSLADTCSMAAETYPFLDTALNTINFNGDDWSVLGERFRSAAQGKGKFSVLYLGDSHVQADFGGAVVRSVLSESSRPAGRGLVVPFKLASTNEPVDYAMSLGKCDYTSSRLLKKPWNTDMPFTGIGVRPDAETFAVDVSCRTSFSTMDFYYTGPEPAVRAVVAESGDTLRWSGMSRGDGRTALRLDTLVNRAVVNFDGGGATTFAAVELLADTVGTVVHSIGNNGATYSSYLGIDGFGKGIASLSPDLIVVALGTNEAFGKLSATGFTESVDRLVRSLRVSCPEAKLLLVTPVECFRTVYRRSKASKGRRSRRRAVKTVNTDILQVRNLLLDYAGSHSVPVYDHYAVAGGKGAADKLKSAGLLGRDGVHFTAGGYRLWGNLLGGALLENLYQPADSIGE